MVDLRRAARALGAAVWCVCAAGVVVGQEDPPAKEPPKSRVPAAAFRASRAEWAPRVVKELTDYAQWCRKSGMLAAEADAYAAALRFEPDNETARKALGHVRKAGVWTPPATPRAPRDGAKADRAGAAERRAAALAAYRDAVLPALRDDAGLDAPALVAREELLAELAALLPDDVELREARGEVRDGGKWVLRETPPGRARRKELVAAAAAAMKSAPVPEPAESSEVENALGVAWKGRVRTDLVRTLAATTSEEAVRTARVAHASCELFRTAFDGLTGPAGDWTVFIVEPAAGPKLFDAHPEATDEQRKRSRRLSGYWFGKGANLVCYGPAPETRLDMASRQAFAHLMVRRDGLTGARGALFDGCGNHLTWLLLGTRLTWFFRTEDYARTAGAERAADRLQGRDVALLGEAAKIFGTDLEPRFENLLRVDVNALDPTQFLCAYAFCVYLLEARPDALDAVVKGVVAGEPPEKTLVEALRLAPEQVGPRLKRWIQER